MKNLVKTKKAPADDPSSDGIRVWIGSVLSQSLAPLLDGLGIDLLAERDRVRAAILVEVAAQGRGASAAARKKMRQPAKRMTGRCYSKPRTRWQRQAV